MKVIQKIRGYFLNDSQLDGFAAYRPFEVLEIIFGLRPYKLYFPLNGDISAPTTKLTKTRIAFTLFHVFSFVTACTIILCLHPALENAITNSPVEKIQNQLQDVLTCINTIIIFVSLFVCTDLNIPICVLISKIDHHCKIIGVNMEAFNKNMFYYSIFAFAFVLLWLIGLFIQGILYWAKVTDNEYFVIFGIADVMPIVYIQIVLVQFCVAIVFLKIRWDNLNTILMELYKREQLNFNVQKSVLL